VRKAKGEKLGQSLKQIKGIKEEQYNTKERRK
jgi:hypothetical protein